MPLVQNHLRRSSISSNPASPGTQPGRLPHSPARTRTKPDIDMTDTDSLNPEEVYKCALIPFDFPMNIYLILSIYKYSFLYKNTSIIFHYVKIIIS